MNTDLIIIGAGPAGLAAAQYGARAGLKVLLVEQLTPGGQAVVIDVLENYPGNIEQLDALGNVVSPAKSGYEFAIDMYRQAESFGASFYTGSVTSIKKKNDTFYIALTDGKTFTAPAVIIASGCKPRTLNIPGEKEYKGKGVSYCATCDGNFFKGKKIFVVGGGDAACDEARHLSRLSDKIILIHRRESFRAQKALVERTINNPNIEVRLNTVIKEIMGDAGKVNSVLLQNVKTGDGYTENTDAVFIFSGTVPQSSFMVAEFEADKGIKINLDESGYIITNQAMETNIPGLYAAGDIRSGAFRQVVTAAADGAVAAHFADAYINSSPS